MAFDYFYNKKIVSLNANIIHIQLNRKRKYVDLYKIVIQYYINIKNYLTIFFLTESTIMGFYINNVK